MRKRKDCDLIPTDSRSAILDAAHRVERAASAMLSAQWDLEQAEDLAAGELRDLDDTELLDAVGRIVNANMGLSELAMQAMAAVRALRAVAARD